jgi:hypothetical protein
VSANHRLFSTCESKGRAQLGASTKECSVACPPVDLPLSLRPVCVSCLRRVPSRCVPSSSRCLWRACGGLAAPASAPLDPTRQAKEREGEKQHHPIVEHYVSLFVWFFSHFLCSWLRCSPRFFSVRCAVLFCSLPLLLRGLAGFKTQRRAALPTRTRAASGGGERDAEGKREHEQTGRPPTRVCRTSLVACLGALLLRQISSALTPALCPDLCPRSSAHRSDNGGGAHLLPPHHPLPFSHSFLPCGAAPAVR